MPDPISSRNGLVIFAKNPQRVASFYQHTLDMQVVENEPSHRLLQNDCAEIIVHAIPPTIAQNLTIEDPPELREYAAFKPVFIVANLEKARRLAMQTGGNLKPMEQTWSMHGHLLLDAWDPEGNILQLKQPENNDR